MSGSSLTSLQHLICCHNDGCRLNYSLNTRRFNFCFVVWLVLGVICESSEKTTAVSLSVNNWSNQGIFPWKRVASGPHPNRWVFFSTPLKSSSCMSGCARFCLILLETLHSYFIFVFHLKLALWYCGGRKHRLMPWIFQTSCTILKGHQMSLMPFC